jgi:hypothetical protein
VGQSVARETEGRTIAITRDSDGIDRIAALIARRSPSGLPDITSLTGRDGVIAVAVAVCGSFDEGNEADGVAEGDGDAVGSAVGVGAAGVGPGGVGV